MVRWLHCLWLVSTTDLALSAPTTEFVERWRSSEAYTQLMRDIDENDKQHPIGGQDLEKFQTSRRAQQAKNQSVLLPASDI